MSSKYSTDIVTFDWGEGFAWGGLAKLGCFRFFDQLWRALDANPMDQNFGANCFWKIRKLHKMHESPTGGYCSLR